MTSRRLIRIKVLQLLYAYSKKESATLAEIERDLLKSMSKSTDLYYETLLLITEVRRKAFQKIDTARNRRFASNVDLNPNTRFIDNPVFNILENNKKFFRAAQTDRTRFIFRIDHTGRDVLSNDGRKEYLLER